MSDVDETGGDVVAFPGYDEPAAVDKSQPGVPGLKPVTLGPAIVRISYAGTKVLVDIHIQKLGIFDARDFDQMQLYPGHLKDSATLSDSVLEKKVTVSLEVIPAERVVVSKFSGSESIVSHLPSKPVRIPSIAGAYPFPDVSGLRHARRFTKAEVERMISEGVRHKQPAVLAAGSQPPDGTDLITMLGGGPWLEALRTTFAGAGLAAPDASSELDVLIAVGVRTSEESVLVVDSGFGFFYKPGLFSPEYVGLFTMAHTGIGVALKFSADLTCGLYWGSADRSQTALQAFGSVNAFIRVSAGALALDFHAELTRVFHREVTHL